jgi:hypothetical protein
LNSQCLHERSRIPVLKNQPAVFERPCDQADSLFIADFEVAVTLNSN